MTEKDKAFSSIDFVGQCLVDEKRTLAFKKAINKVVKNNHVVLDIGTGSGIMALLAAKAGAKKVCAVEFDPFVATIPQKAIILNKFENKISVFIEDAGKIDFQEKIKFDVVISELLTTGMVDEAQIQVMNNLQEKKLVDNSTIFIPKKQDTHISLTNTDFSIFDLKIPMVLHLWKWHKWNNLKIKHLTNNLLLNSINFNKKNDEQFESIVTFEVIKNGVINSILLTSRTFLTDQIFIDGTEALNAPMCIPISEKLVTKGQKLKIKISYIFGSGYENFNAQFVK